MGIFADLFGQKPYPRHASDEVERLLTELLRIGKTDDFLSERPGSPFNMQCRHVRARQIGQRFHEIGGLPLMLYVAKQVRKKLGKDIHSHLEYAWTDIGDWVE
jgi:hypothetical protein